MEQESTTQKDIDALLSMLWRDGRDKYHAALTALVAERDEYKAGIGSLWKIIESASARSPVDQTITEALTALVAERDALRQRVAELEVARVLTLSRAFQSEEALRHDRDRDLRERLVCAALTGILSNSDFKLGEEESGSWVVRYADATLSAMRKGATDGK